MTMVRTGAWISVAWGDEDDASGTSLHVEVCCCPGGRDVPVSELRTLATFVERTLLERFDHQRIDTGTPDIRAFAARVLRTLTPELERRRFVVESVVVREKPLWSLELRRSDVLDA